MRAALAVLVVLAALGSPRASAEDEIPCLDTSALPSRPHQAIGAAPCGIGNAPVPVELRVCNGLIRVAVFDPTALLPPFGISYELHHDVPVLEEVCLPSIP